MNFLVNTYFYVPRGVLIRKDAEMIIKENPVFIRTGKEQIHKGVISELILAPIKMFHGNYYDTYEENEKESPVVSRISGTTVLCIA